MKNKKFSHRGYDGSVDVSIEDGCLHGKILFINDIITYEGATVDGLESAFREAVDHYIEYCAQRGTPANKPYSGTFNIRIGQELHRKAAREANKLNISLNDYVAKAINKAVEKNDIMKIEHTHHHCLTITGDRPTEPMFASTDKLAAWEEVISGPVQ